MALILSIDTATEYAGICLSKDGEILAFEEHANQKNHAAFLQPAIQQLMQQSGLLLSDIDAVAVTGGPGSYTGIRVGLASAKGICYALNKPLIVLNTLQIIARAACDAYIEKNGWIDQKIVFYPMIDARRMEVFKGEYDVALTTISDAEAVILDDVFFSTLSDVLPVIFCGNGALKIPQAYLINNRIISTVKHSVKHMVDFAEKIFANKNFVNLSFSAPFYIKEFYNVKNN
jgi:tRNA threonylcarbamoyladenosine biosynthesis protein TsaB